MFDKIIRENLIATEETENSFGYEFQDMVDDEIIVRKYDEYYSETKFADFVEVMKTEYPLHFRKFRGDIEAEDNKGGKGGELVCKTYKGKLVPPKMASVASLSRFCYLALRDGSDKLIPDRKVQKDDVEFEKECGIFEIGNHAPQLDAYIKDSECDTNVTIE